MSAAPTVLILGGTTEARELATILAAPGGPRTITSLAGRVDDPSAIAGEVRTGGFGGAGELRRWIVERDVRAVVDATHPFAARISRNAAEACVGAGVPLIALRRPGWSPQPGDDWRWATDLDDAASRVGGLGHRALLTIGRQEARAFADVADVWFLVRSIGAPAPPLPPRHELLLRRGPFALADELALLDRHRIDVVVSKDSGGDATRAKLDAARERGVPVLLVRRPDLPAGAGIVTVATAGEAATAVLRRPDPAGP